MSSDGDIALNVLPLLLDKIANELDRLADSDLYFIEIHKKLIEIKPDVQEAVIRAKSLNPNVAETMDKEYEELLRLTKGFGGGGGMFDDGLVKTNLRSAAKGLRRFNEVLPKEFTSADTLAKQHAEQPTEDIGKAKQRQQKKRQTRKKPEIEQSLPLAWHKWADVFGVSENTLRKLREQKKYHFCQVSARRWTLPKHELPAEYLEKYRHAVPQTQPKTQ